MGNCNCDLNLKQNDQELLIHNQVISKSKNKKKKRKNSESNSSSFKSEDLNQNSDISHRSDNSGNKSSQKYNSDSFRKGHSMSSAGSSKLITNPLIKKTIGNIQRVILPEIRIINIGVYIGEWKDGKRDGKGIFKWDDGD